MANNDYYNNSSYPTPNSPGTSANMRSELAAIKSGFDKLPDRTGNAKKVVVVSEDESSLVATGALTALSITTSTVDGSPVGATTPAAGSFTTLTVSGATNLGSQVNIDGGTIDGTPIGGSSASSGTFTTVSATSGFTGNLTGNVTGNLTGNVTGNVSGNITAATGTSTFNNVTINGSLDMNAGTAGTITGLSAPSAASDAATKAYVDTSINNLISSAPGTLDTLNEIATALGNDPNFAATMTTQLASKLSLSGGTMTGAIAMSNNKVSGVATPTLAQDAANKTYVDIQRDTRLSTSGGTLTGPLAMSANRITGLADPTSGQDAATKAYIDNVFGSTASAAASAAAAATSATNAANSATSASNSSITAQSAANTATTKAGEATSGAQTATTKASEAATSASNALTYANNAASSSTTAATKATEASNSATSAAASASTATTKASEASASASSASSSATSAGNSATSASGSATSAANSATSAANSATAAAASAASAATGDFSNFQASGTANGVAYLNASKVLTSGSALTFDGTSLLGLAVAGNGGISLGDRGTNATYYIGRSGGGSLTGNTTTIGFSGDGSNAGNILYNTYVGSHVFNISGSEQMRLTSTGLGIGTSSPGSLWSGANKLVVGGGSGAAGATIYTGAGDAGTLAFAKGLTGNDPYRGFVQYGQNNDAMLFGTAGTTKATLDASGNLGLGVTPSAWASGHKAIQVNSAAFKSYGGSQLIACSNDYLNTSGVDTYINTGYAASYAQINGAHSWYTAPSGTAGNPISFTQAMTLDASGNLSLGTTGTLGLGSSTRGLVAINGSSDSVVGFGNAGSLTGYILSNSSTLEINAQGSRSILLNTNGTERARIDSSGNLGIGTSSPGAKLDVNGAAKFGSSVYLNGTVLGLSGVMEGYSTVYGTIAAWRTVPSDGINPFFAIDTSANGITLRSDGSSYRSLMFATGGSAKMTLDASGNLGIGTSSISDPAGYGGKVVNVIGPMYSFQSNDTTKYVSLGVAGGTTYLQANGTGNSLQLWTAGSSRATLDASGNLGLGVTPGSWYSTRKAFQVGSTAAMIADSGGVEIRQNALLNSSGSEVYLASNYASIYSQGSGQHRWYTAPSGTAGAAISLTQAMTLDASSNLILGGTTAYATFTVKANTSANGVSIVGRTSDNIGVLNFLNSSGTNAAAIYNNPTALVFDVASIERARIDSSGNLLVGKTAGTFSAAGTAIIANGEIDITRNGSFALALNRLSSDGEIAQFYRQTSQVGSISVTTTTTTYNTSSDYRLKNITGPITTSGQYIDSLKPVEGTWKADGSTFVGLIAHEVQEVSRTQVATGVKDGEEMQGMDYSSSEIIANLIAELQSVRRRLAALEAK